MSRQQESSIAKQKIQMMDRCEDPKPTIKITVRPTQSLRFGYKSEDKKICQKALDNKKSDLFKNVVPIAQLMNATDIEKAVIKCTLVTSGQERGHQNHYAFIRQNGHQTNHIDIEVTKSNIYTATFSGLNIAKRSKDESEGEIVERWRETDDEEVGEEEGNSTMISHDKGQMECQKQRTQESMDFKTVTLYFQAFAFGDQSECLVPITEEVYWQPTKNMKNSFTRGMKIHRMSMTSGVCHGGNELCLLVSRIGEVGDLRVKFYELDEKKNVIWDADGYFGPDDVHHRTPCYKDVNITKAVQVLLQLQSKSDARISNSLTFSYLPSNQVLVELDADISSKTSNPDYNTKNEKFDPDPRKYQVLSPSRVINPRLGDFPRDWGLIDGLGAGMVASPNPHSTVMKRAS
ncbi:hypothetical protein QAD02_011317 [Eretmocerus hayati]|uniref:Uncharacterized protein n=1 Tax=Eretmocerus hayati TaxID=131215 RepID=A0ACC2NWL1_9HYME|nr:hypothetical protein QAD02_011317 [Eretmocerus hayati]